MPKAQALADRQKERRHNPLAQDYAPTSVKPRPAKRRKSKPDDEAEEDNFVDSKASRKILQIGQDLADEEESELKARQVAPATNSAFSFESRFGEDTGSDAEAGAPDDEEAWGDEEEEEITVEETNAEDLDVFERFNPSFNDPLLRGLHQPAEPSSDTGQSTNLADLILEKIAAAEAAQGEQGADGPPIIGGGAPEDAIELPAKVVDVYTKIGLILSRYKSGPLPKPFKILPTTPQWETLLSITRPESWTPNAVYEATRIFVSTKPPITQTFLREVLLEAVRDDIRETRKLNVHLYKALKKALYKPAAFFKGLLFPLLQSGTCTLREAHIIASVVQRVSVPVLHSAAALYWLCETAAAQMSQDVESAGAANIFIRTLLEKKYALPYRVVDALVFHFLRFRAADPAQFAQGPGQGAEAMETEGSESRTLKEHKLPVLWHQCLLAFAQRYRNDITEDQREALLDLLLVKGHRQIGPEVRRELLEGRGRGVPNPESAGLGVGGDDTMMAMD